MDQTVDWSKMYLPSEALGVRGYTQQHFETCKRLWQTYVPKRGQADCIQGELLREAEKLRNEANDNGNRNWDDNFAWFCTHIAEVLTASGLFDEERLRILNGILAIIRDAGAYAAAYVSGSITDEDCDPVKLAYVGEDIYDYIEDMIAEYAEANPAPIPYQKQDFIYR